MSTYGGQPGFGPPYGGPPRPSRRGVLTAAGVVLAVLLGAAALIVALTREPPAPAAAPQAPTTQQGPTTDADRKLCQAIAPLMKENDDRSNAFLGTGQPGSPEQDAALPK